MMTRNKIRITILSFLLTILLALFLTGCQTRHSVKVERGTLELPDLSIDTEKIDIHTIKFNYNGQMICLDEKNANLLLQNINNIKIAYYKIYENYKNTVKNYNDLKKIAYTNDKKSYKK